MSEARRLDTGTVLNLALLLGGAYIAFKYVIPALSTVGRAASAAGEALSQRAADTILAVTSPGVLQPESQTMGIPGSVTFPTGAVVPFAQIQNQSGVWSATDSKGNFYFTYQGSPVYQLQGSSSSGWQAVAVPGVTSLSAANQM